MTLGQRIKNARLARGLQQTDLVAAGIHQKNVSKYENDATVPSATNLLRVAEALGLTTDYLLTGATTEVHDRALLDKFRALQNVDDRTRAVVDDFLDLVIRDANARKAYAT